MFYESGTSSHSEAAGFRLLLHDTCKKIKKKHIKEGKKDIKTKHTNIHHSQNFNQEESFHRQEAFCETRGACSSFTSERHDILGQKASRAEQSRGSALV